MRWRGKIKRNIIKTIKSTNGKTKKRMEYIKI